MKNIPLPPTSHKPQKYTGPSADEVLALRKQFMNPGIFLYYKKPIMLVEGSMQYVWDDTGKRYLDGLGGIVTVSVGHCHPHVVAAARKQNEILQHSTTIYLQPNVALYAEKLASKMPGDLKMCYFVNSGSEANDLALLMARAYTQNYDIDLVAQRLSRRQAREQWVSRRTAIGNTTCRTVSACITRSRRIPIAGRLAMTTRMRAKNTRQT